MQGSRGQRNPKYPAGAWDPFAGICRLGVAKHHQPEKMSAASAAGDRRNPEPGIWMAIRRYFMALFHPIDEGRLKALGLRWRALSEELQSKNQAMGRYVVGCGATHGVHERCNFGCTACYLSTTANQQPPLPFAAVESQLRALRAYLGSGGNVQITSGEVTLLPAGDLVRILRAARELDLSPMVMTHGDVILHDQAYLDQLVVEGGLRKISIHVDLTQRGRIGLRMPRSEDQCNEVRDRFARLFRDCRERTGVKLKAAMTLTVNRRNLEQLPAVIAWFLDHLDSFRITSFQPQAQTGRTRGDDGVGMEEVWQCLERSLGFSLNPHPFQFGHRACNRTAFLLSLRTSERRVLLQAVRADNPRDQRIVAQALCDFGGLVLSERPPLEITLKVVGLCLRKPVWLLRLPLYALLRSWQERAHIPFVLWNLVRFRLSIRPLVFVVHAFMSQREMETDLGRERLAGCIFRLAVDGRMVSMCEMNASTLRQSTYRVV